MWVGEADAEPTISVVGFDVLFRWVPHPLHPPLYIFLAAGMNDGNKKYIYSAIGSVIDLPICGFILAGVTAANGRNTAYVQRQQDRP